MAQTNNHPIRSSGGVKIRSGNGNLKNTKVLFRGGVNPASGSLVAGSRVRVVHSPAKKIKKYGP